MPMTTNEHLNMIQHELNQLINSGVDVSIDQIWDEGRHYAIIIINKVDVRDGRLVAREEPNA